MLSTNIGLPLSQCLEIRLSPTSVLTPSVVVEQVDDVKMTLNIVPWYLKSSELQPSLLHKKNFPQHKLLFLQVHTNSYRMK